MTLICSNCKKPIKECTCITRNICPNCGSNRTAVVCMHHNRRKKQLIYVMVCDNCKKRFNVEGEKKHYNHTGNAVKKNKLCHLCHEHFDNDTEKEIGICFYCMAKAYDSYGHTIGTFDDWFSYICDYDCCYSEFTELIFKEGNVVAKYEME